MPTCPTDGSELFPVVAAPDAAPWGCAACARGFTEGELRLAAGGAWNPVVRSWRAAALADAAKVLERDRDSAERRGSSLLDAHLPMLDAAMLDVVADDERISAGLRDRVKAERARRPAKAAK